jgi:membrane associated rhomboid family serine protease
MLFPIGDDNRDRKITPFINYLLILINILFLFSFRIWDIMMNSLMPTQLSLKRSLRDVILLQMKGFLKIHYPERDSEFQVFQESPTPVYLTLLTSMFMHGGLAHIFGNMLFLLIFGDNLENKLGHLRYLFFFLLTGILASLAHVFTTVYLDQNTLIPTLGASGAISGVLGGYILLFPKRRVRVILFYFITDVPAIFAIGLWFVFQLTSGIGMLGPGAQEGGIAYAAHIGGFIAGFILIKFFAINR